MGKGDPQPSPWRLVPILAIAAALAQPLPPLETISSTALRIRPAPEAATPRSPFGIQTGKRAKELTHLRHISPHELALLVAALKPLAAGLQATGLQESLGRSTQPAQATAARPGSGARCPQPEQRGNGALGPGKTLGPGATGCGH